MASEHAFVERRSHWAYLSKHSEENPFGNFRFTGSLRPAYPLSPRRSVPSHIPRPDYADDGKIKKPKLLRSL